MIGCLQCSCAYSEPFSHFDNVSGTSVCLLARTNYDAVLLKFCESLRGSMQGVVCLLTVCQYVSPHDERALDIAYALCESWRADIRAEATTALPRANLPEWGLT